MPSLARRLLPLALAGLLGAAIAGCGTSVSATRSAPPATVPAAATEAATSPVPTVDLTPVPGGASASPDDIVGGPTVQTDWGTILVNPPEGFPRYPGAAGAEPMDGPVTDAWEASAAVDEVASWYAATFEELGWSQVDLGSALEDGSRVLDLASDLPECRVQLAFRPLGGSTMITLLYGAGCAGGDG